MDKLEISARMTVREGQLEGFKRQAAEMIRVVREKDTKTLRYEWFLSDDKTKCEVREAYESSEGFIEHAMHIGEVRDALFAYFADDHAVTIYGEPSPQLLAAVKHVRGVDIKWYSPLAGLDF
jgi:quinol monooxygenase YgiN